MQGVVVVSDRVQWGRDAGMGVGRKGVVLKAAK